MPTLTTSYTKLDPKTQVDYPVLTAYIRNMKNGNVISVRAMLDTGADSCTIGQDLWPLLGIQDIPGPTIDIAGVNAAAPIAAMKCDFLQIGLLDSKRIPYFPNKDKAVPTLFVPTVPIPLLGRELFLNLCTVTLDHRKGIFVVEF